MATTNFSFSFEDRRQYSYNQMQFVNYNLHHQKLLENIKPIVNAISKRMELAYKSKTLIEYQGNIFFSETLINFLQFDDVCLKIKHLDSGIENFIVLGSRLARMLLIRLLSTSLIDDYSSLPFSSTEKGIFSFIFAKLLYDLKNDLKNSMPNFKLLGVYHVYDEAIATISLKDFGGYNFILSFDNAEFPITIAIPMEFYRDHHHVSHHQSNLLDRCGHIKNNFTLSLKKISMSQNAFKDLMFGDQIFFDHCDISMHNHELYGQAHAVWRNLVILGELKKYDDTYGLLIERLNVASLVEDNYMEELEITHSRDLDQNDSVQKNNQLESLAKNIRVNLSIELASIPMTLREICGISEGEIIDLHRKIEDPLSLVVEGKIIGYCQPVQIEGRLGIRVLEIIGEEKEQL